MEDVWICIDDESKEMYTHMCLELVSIKCSTCFM